MTCYIRSNDMYRAWPLNAFGLRMIQKNVCVELNRRINEDILRENNDNCKFGCKIDTKEDMVEMGSLIIISHSAHIYNENFKDVELIIKDHYKFTPCYDDPNGYYTISLNKDLIVIQHYDIKGKLMREVTGCDFNELSTKLVENLLTDDKFHLMYLGREIFKADFCLKHGIEYVQDLEL
ncbi:hypothetical protein A0H76_1976 [Hepatospora eriocheir]|uniref:DUF4346 domain-containing protein n=1 Tax=Hepatospora eriocheir TaxID=1081669 RepID=A0A1X0QKF9_9MICR|nr:hypothetical protein A0H76_1976 [Hepatospora eriocheir]